MTTHRRIRVRQRSGISFSSSRHISVPLTTATIIRRHLPYITDHLLPLRARSSGRKPARRFPVPKEDRQRDTSSRPDNFSCPRVIPRARPVLEKSLSTHRYMFGLYVCIYMYVYKYNIKYIYIYICIYRTHTRAHPCAHAHSAPLPPFPLASRLQSPFTPRASPFAPRENRSAISLDSSSPRRTAPNLHPLHDERAQGSASCRAASSDTPTHAIDPQSTPLQGGCRGGRLVAGGRPRSPCRGCLRVTRHV